MKIIYTLLISYMVSLNACEYAQPKPVTMAFASESGRTVFSPELSPIKSPSALRQHDIECPLVEAINTDDFYTAFHLIMNMDPQQLAEPFSWSAPISYEGSYSLANSVIIRITFMELCIQKKNILLMELLRQQGALLTQDLGYLTHEPHVRAYINAHVAPLNDKKIAQIVSSQLGLAKLLMTIDTDETVGPYMIKTPPIINQITAQFNHTIAKITAHLKAK